MTNVPNQISIHEHLKIARELEKHHAIFERVWSMSRIRFSKKVPTAGVLFNKKGECIDFIVNREFWEGLSFNTQCFVISHECLHIALNHGQRTTELSRLGRDVSNKAQDIVINHSLTDFYGYDREEIDPEGKYCWVDKFFKPEEDIHNDENYEFYYNRLMKMAQQQLEELKKLMENAETVDDHEFGQGQPQPGQGQGYPQQGEGQPQPGEGDGGIDPNDLDPDEFDYFDPDDYSSDFSDVIEKLNDELTEDEKETLQNFVEENEGSNGDTTENPDYGPTGVSSGIAMPSPEDETGEAGGQSAGTTAGTSWRFAKKIREPKKHKFEHIITSWARSKMKEEYKVIDQWIFKNRRFNMINTGLMLPTEYETLEKEKFEEKFEVWFFQDTSGSCSGYTDRFFSIAEGMPLDKFNMRMFCFDTKVYETSLESRKLYGFGGTYFHILENHVMEEFDKDPNFHYPDAIFVVTDGYGSDIVPSMPENWHWILTPGASKGNIPDACNFHDLANYE